MERTISAACAAGFFAICANALPAAANVSAAPPAAAPSGWAATHTAGSPLSLRFRGAPLAGSTPLHVTVGLTMPGRAAADRLLIAEHTPGNPMYRHTISPQRFTAAFNPSGARVNAVAAYLAREGFRNISVTPNNLLVTADASAAQASHAFHTSFAQFVVRGKATYANTSPALVPTELAGTVTAVLGLSTAITSFLPYHVSTNAPKPVLDGELRKACDMPTGNICALNSYGPLDFAIAYDQQSTPTASRAPIAVIATGDVSQVLPDLRTYEKRFGLPQVPYTVVPVGIASTDASGLDEFDLDTQTSTGIAGNVSRLYVYDGTDLSDASTSLEFNRFVTDDLAVVGNASFSGCETFAFADGSMLLDDEIFLQGASQGQTLFSSTGDSGFGCGVAVNTGLPGIGSLPEAGYPAASPYVVGAGGTTLVTNAPSGTYDTEAVWTGGGGAISVHEGAPFWTAGVVNAGLRMLGKTIPDASMDADPNTGAYVVVNGKPIGVGGTSLSSPLLTGVWARLESGHGISSTNTGWKGFEFGFAGPELYHIYYRALAGCNATATTACVPVPPAGATTGLVGGFHDILVGSSGGPDLALPGYDLGSGLGTIDIAKMFVAIDPS